MFCHPQFDTNHAGHTPGCSAPCPQPSHSSRGAPNTESKGASAGMAWLVQVPTGHMSLHSLRLPEDKDKPHELLPLQARLFPAAPSKELSCSTGQGPELSSCDKTLQGREGPGWHSSESTVPKLAARAQASPPQCQGAQTTGIPCPCT